MINCPICEGEIKNKIWSSYDEPPENLDQCDNCGYNEYYSYYENYATYMQTFIKDSEGHYVSRNILIFEDEKGFAEPTQYKRELEKFLAKELRTIEDLINVRKLAKEEKTRMENERKQKQINDKQRWAEGNLAENELKKVEEFLNRNLKKVEELRDLGIASNLEKEYRNGFLENIKFTINEEKMSDYVGQKNNAQKNYCISAGLPVFAPNSCFSCGSSIYGVKLVKQEMFGKKYETISEPISMEKCSTQLITGCPSCNRSFVD